MYDMVYNNVTICACNDDSENNEGFLRFSTLTRTDKKCTVSSLSLLTKTQ